MNRLEISPGKARHLPGNPSHVIQAWHGKHTARTQPFFLHQLFVDKHLIYTNLITQLHSVLKYLYLSLPNLYPLPRTKAH